jgi:hypothetical protein
LWVYVQKSGELFDNKGHCVGVGYAGKGMGKNNPDAQNVRDIGPLPVGRYTIVPVPFDHPRCGKDCLRLLQHKGNQMFGRDGFLMHGDSIKEPGTASDGCMIQAHNTRLLVATSGDTLLEVIADFPGIRYPDSV